MRCLSQILSDMQSIIGTADSFLDYELKFTFQDAQSRGIAGVSVPGTKRE